jgi:hypothetical protein
MCCGFQAVKTAYGMRPVILSECQGAGKLLINARLAALRAPFNPLFPRVMRITPVCGGTD